MARHLNATGRLVVLALMSCVGLFLVAQIMSAAQIIDRHPGESMAVNEVPRSTMPLLEVLPTELPREYVRGVAPENRLKYDGESLTCDNGRVVEGSAINDDYCDCNDGMDEPGTSACPNTQFYCLPDQMYIRSSAVNDHVCDCCDGSDEWASGKICPDSCAQIALLHAERDRIRHQGSVVRQLYISQAKQSVSQTELAEWGVHLAFFQLQSTKLDGKFGEFSYHISLFSEVKQTDKSHHTVTLGRQYHWKDDVSGLFDGGDRCHVGINRSAKVKFTCDLETRVVGVAEPERCNYELTISTPAACIV